MDITNALIEIGVPMPERELPSLEAVYKYLDEVLQEEKALLEKQKAELPEGTDWYFVKDVNRTERKIFKIDHLMTDLLLSIPDETKAKAHESPEAFEEFRRAVRHMCDLRARRI